MKKIIACCVFSFLFKHVSILQILVFTLIKPEEEESQLLSSMPRTSSNCMCAAFVSVGFPSRCCLRAQALLESLLLFLSQS